jgi:hypothetical protein
MADQAAVRRISWSLPETTQEEDGAGYRVVGKLFAWTYLERGRAMAPRTLVKRFDAGAPH